MKLSNISFIFATILATSCTPAKQQAEKIEHETEVEATSTNEEKVNVALTFINSYVENSNKMNEAQGLLEWVNSQTNASASFKSEVKRIIDEAFKEDPEMGLDADPIFDAQDYPEDGFEFQDFDAKTGLLVVKGINNEDFNVTMKFVYQDGQTKVDGCGVINIPSDKRSKR